MLSPAMGRPQHFSTLLNSHWLLEPRLLPHVMVMTPAKEKIMNQIIYIVGLVVIVLAILSFFGFR